MKSNLYLRTILSSSKSREPIRRNHYSRKEYATFNRSNHAELTVSVSESEFYNALVLTSGPLPRPLCKAVQTQSQPLQRLSR